MNEKAPPGWSGTIIAMRKHHGSEISNPWALAHWMRNRGEQPHYKEAPSKDSRGNKVPKKKKKYREHLSFREYVSLRENNS